MYDAKSYDAARARGRWIASRKRSLAALAGALAISLAGCDSRTADPNRPIVARVSSGPPGEMDVWRDRETGCEYISYTSSAGLTPRLSEAGWPICRKSGDARRPAIGEDAR